MPVGIFVCSGSLLVGAIIGASLNRFIPEHLKKTLPLIAGLISISMGAFFLNKLVNLPPIALAVIVGTIIGCLLNIEKWIERAGTKLRTPIEKIFPTKEDASLSSEDFINQFIAVLILFCASGTGIFGALTEGMTGDATILITKSILDFFTAAIFASALGYIIRRYLCASAHRVCDSLFCRQLHHDIAQPTDDRRFYRLRRHHHAGNWIQAMRHSQLSDCEHATGTDPCDAFLHRLATVYRLRFSSFSLPPSSPEYWRCWPALSAFAPRRSPFYAPAPR
nr:Putative inner membrane protein YqgA [Salmonella sp. NCTC 7297]